MSVSKAVRLLRTKINRNGCRSNRTMAMQDWQLSMPLKKPLPHDFVSLIYAHAYGIICFEQKYCKRGLFLWKEDFYGETTTQYYDLQHGALSEIEP